MSAREYMRYCMRPTFIVHVTTIHMCIKTCVANRVDFMAMAALDRCVFGLCGQCPHN